MPGPSPGDHQPTVAVPTPSDAGQTDALAASGGPAPSTVNAPGSAASAGPTDPPSAGQATVSLDSGRSSPTGPAVRGPVAVDVPGCTILGELGRGGMGVVYQARQMALKRLVAVKVIRSAALAGVDEFRRFRAEAEAVAHLQHPNIVQIYEVGESGGAPYCVLEFVEGGSLAQKLAGKPLPPDEAARLAEALARAAAYAHQRQVVHRDLKPANVLLTADGTPKITDFGLAKRLDDDTGQTRTGQVMGTPAYMAPEQAAGDPSAVGPRTDVYALGAILYEMLTGSAPFTSTNVAAMLLQVQSKEPPAPTQLNPKIPRDLETICLTCLRKDPARRYGSALQLAQDLERYRNGEAILARPEGVVRKLARAMRRRWPMLASGAALAVVLVLGWFVFTAARNARQVSGLEQDVRDGLDAAPAAWTAAHVAELDGRIARLESLAPGEAPRFREELHQKFRGALDERILQPRLNEGDLAPIEEALRAYTGRWPDEAADLQSRFQQRLGGWQEIAHVSAPFTDWQSVLGPLDAAPDAAGLVLHGTGEPVAATTAVPCKGDEEAEARWDASWASAAAVGLALNFDGQKGYRFLLADRSASARKDADQADTAAPVRRAATQRFMQIWRNEQCLREQTIDAPARPIALRAGRRGGRLEFQVNDLKSILFEDPFPLPATQGRLGLLWPPGVALVSFHGRRRMKPADPSPLERGDDLYSAGRFDEALAAYEQEAAAAGAVGLEGRYKAGVCLIELNRPDEAAERLEGVAGVDAERWPLLAASRLWLLYLKQGQPDRAEDVFQSLAAHAGAKDAALYVPGEFSFDPLVFHNTKSGLRYLHARPEDCERIAKTTHALEVMGYPAWIIDLQYQLLVRHRWAVGQTDQALKDAAAWLEKCDKKDPVSRLEDARCALLNRAWILGTLGKDSARRAVAEIDDRIAPCRSLPDRDAPDIYTLCLLERARLQCVLEDWGAAEQDMATCRRILAASPRPGGPGYHACAEAAMIEGFLLERREQTDAAREAWRRGTAKAYQAEYHVGDLGLIGANATVNVVLAAVCGDLDEATAEKTMTDMLKAGGEGMAGQVARMAHITPADLRAAMLSPRAHDVARRYAFGELSFPDWMRAPVMLLGVEKIRVGAFPDGMSADQEEIAWRMGEHLLPLYASGGLSDTQLLQLAYAWSGGFGAAGPLGWGAVAPKLPPEVRGPFAYILANRLLQKKAPSDAEALFRTALADAPADSALHRLAQADLDRLKAK